MEVVRVDQRRRTVPWIALGVVYVLWGSTYLANRFIIVSMPPLLASGFRFMTGGVLLGILVLLFAGPRVFAMTRAQLGTAALSGLLLPAWGNGLVIVAQSQVASGLTALLIASVPLYIAVLRALTGDRPRRATVLGVLVGAAGLVLLVLVGPSGGSGGVSGSAWWGPPLVLLAGAGWATGTFAATRMAVPANPFALATLQQLIGGAVLVATGTIARRAPAPGHGGTRVVVGVAVHVAVRLARGVQRLRLRAGDPARLDGRDLRLRQPRDRRGARRGRGGGAVLGGAARRGCDRAGRGRDGDRGRASSARRRSGPRDACRHRLSLAHAASRRSASSAASVS